MIDGIPRSGRSRVYTRICQQLATDPALKAAGVCWGFADGVKREAKAGKPTVRLFPFLGPMSEYTEDSQRGNLDISVEMFIPTGPNPDVRDVLDLWTAIEDAIKSPGDRPRANKFESKLINCGPHGQDAETGRIVFARPANVRDEDRGGVPGFVAVGSMTLAILRVLNP